METCKNLGNALKTLKGVDRRCDAYVKITKAIANWNVFLPIISDLKEKYMETEDGRHWKKVKDEVANEKDGKGGEFEINDELILDTIYELNMFNHKDNLEEITY